jgi:hypothetical protein
MNDELPDGVKITIYIKIILGFKTLFKVLEVWLLWAVHFKT